MNRLLLDLIRFLLHLPTPKYRLPWLCCVPETNRKVSAFPRTFSAVGLAIVEVRISNVGWSKCMYRVIFKYQNSKFYQSFILNCTEFLSYSSNNSFTICCFLVYQSFPKSPKVSKRLPKSMKVSNRVQKSLKFSKDFKNLQKSSRHFQNLQK